jgi:hypothetical protein
MTGERNLTYLIMALMIFEQGQREFHDGDPPDDPGTSCSKRRETVPMV